MNKRPKFCNADQRTNARLVKQDNTGDEM